MGADTEKSGEIVSYVWDFIYLCALLATLLLSILPCQLNWQYTKPLTSSYEQKNSILLNLFSSDYFWAYDKMIAELSPLLLTTPRNPRLIERLDFRPDLPHGERKRIFIAIAQMLRSGSSVLAQGCRKNDLFRWFSDPEHCNLGITFQAIQRAVGKCVTVDN